MTHFGGVLLLAMALAGCGGGDDETTESAPTGISEAPAALSKEELLAQGDAICAEVNAAVGTVGSTSTEAGQSNQVAELYTGMVERLKGLGAPSDDSAGYEEFIGAAEGLGQAESDVALAAERGEDAALVTAESEASSALSAFQSAAQTYGFEQCGEGPSAPLPGAAGGEAAEEEATGGLEEEMVPEGEEEVVPEEVAPPEEESAGGGAGVGGGTEGGGGESGGGEAGGIGPG